MNGRISAITISLTTALLATALAGSGASAQTGKVGGAEEPVSLELVTGAFTRDFTTDLFIRTVEELSEGSLTIHDAGDALESSIAARVQSGESDLGQVFARGLDEIGGSAFQALLAPFLVTDAPLLKAIVTGPIGADMLAGLEDEGLVGLTLVPGDRRFVIGFEGPLTTLADFAGTTIGIPPASTNDAFIRTLGAEPTDRPGASRAEYLSEGVSGQVTVLGHAESDDEYLTSNLAVHAVPIAWFANADVMAELSPEHRAVLMAAARTVLEARMERVPDVESTLAYCATGGRIVEASADDVAAIEAAAQPVLDSLRSDPVTAGFMARIEELKASIEPAPIPEPCGVSTVSDDLARIPDGRYDATLTRAYALETGWPDECVLGGETGVSILVIEGTAWTQLAGCGDGAPEVGAIGDFEYTGDRLIMREPGIPGQATFAWSADGDTATLTLLETVDEYAPASVLRYLFEHAFTRTSS